MENYMKVSVIGRGTYGIVYKVKCRRTGKDFALKHHTDGVEDTTVRELSCLAALNGHPYVVCMHDCFVDDGNVAMLMPYVPYTLSDVIHNGHGVTLYCEPGQAEQSIPFSFVAHFSHQVAQALSYMHMLNIVHRDLTPFNVLLTEDLTVKVADMGLARQSSKWMSPTVVTEAYRAPELFDEREVYCVEYTCAIDTWSLGVMIADAMEGKVVFQVLLGHRGHKSTYQTVMGTIMPNVMKCELVKRIVLRLLAFCDTERLLAHELLRDTEWTSVSLMPETDRVVVRDRIRRKKMEE